MKAFPGIKLARTCGLILLSLFALAAFANNEFTPVQQQQIQHVVHDYLVNNPEVLVEAGQSLQQQQINKQQQQTNQAIAANKNVLFHALISPKLGAKNSDITVIEFFDYQCGYCRKMEPVLAKILQDDKTVLVIHKHLPIFGERSAYAARLALAAQLQGKYLAFHQALMSAKGGLDQDKLILIAQATGLNTKKLIQDSQNPNVTQELAANQQLANSLGLMGTPALIVAKSKERGSSSAAYLVPSAVRLETLQAMINRLRQN